MSLLDGLTPPKNKALYCKVDLTLKELDSSDKQVLTDALANIELWGSRTLSIALRKRGIELADTTIAKHRKQQCTCYRG